MDNLKDHLVIVIALEHYNPLSQLRALGENGINPVFIAIKHKVRVASPSKYPSKVFLVENEEEAFDILMREYGNVAEKTGIKPILSFSDDKTVTFYDKKYDEFDNDYVKSDFNKPEYNKTNPIYPGQASAKITVSVDGMGRDEMDERRSYERYFREHLYIDDLKQSYPYDHGRIDEILELLVDTVCSTAKTIRCAGEDRPAEVVKSRFMKLDYGHIQYVLDCIHDNTTDIRNIKAYMLTTLYNAPITIDHYYQAKVNHDLYGWREEDA